VKSFKDWKIRSKLVLPLFVIVVLGGGGIISVFAGMYDEITNDTLPEERALDGIRRASLELLVEYREFMLVPSDSTQLEIEELKNEIEVYEAAFGKSALHEEYEAPFVETIEAAEQNLKRQGDKAIAVRLRLLDQFEGMEAFETAFHDLHPGGSVDAGHAEDAAAGVELADIGDHTGLDAAVHIYMAKIHEYVLTPNDATRQKIAEIELSLEWNFLADDDELASEPGDPAGDTNQRILVRQLVELGHGTVALTSDFLAALETLEEAEDNLLDVLEAAGTVIAQETDQALTVGFVIVTAVILAVLATIFLVGYLVSQGIRTPLTALANATDRLGKGDLSVRADMKSKDEIGVLATAFNRMAANLESNIVQRERAEETLKEREQQSTRLIENLPGLDHALRERGCPGDARLPTRRPDRQPGSRVW
jgi:HAMP domain-containing protein